MTRKPQHIKEINKNVNTMNIAYNFDRCDALEAPAHTPEPRDRVAVGAPPVNHGSRELEC